MAAPLVSVCLPNLNNLAYLEERIDTILRQTFSNWELIVSDNESDDGAWSFFEALAHKNRRVSIAQAPRAGMYANWNNCIRRARGEFVYIATSDDSMAPDCLEKLVAALTAHPDCDLAHCPLKVFDQCGRETGEFQESLFAESSGKSFGDFHVRRAPFDGLLHLVGSTVYISITQLLIRRSLFDRIGLFESAWGSVGDFNWDMRACLVANTVHVPDTWGGWRVHANQATANVQLRSAEHHHKIETMIDHAIANCSRLLKPRLQRELVSRWSIQAKMFRTFEQEITSRRSPLQRRSFIARQLLAGSAPACVHVKTKAFGQPSWRESFPDRVRRWLNDVEFGPTLVSGTVAARM